ncbi:MAG: extensin family protein, partial [Myxococcota bacterium]|nr:extensin family protein [Myxococcota bacterium]
LDGLPRAGAFVVAGCPEVPLIDRAGEPVPWRPPLRIHAAFEDAVRALERAVVETSIETYGMAPTRILSASSHRCTTVRTRPERISEHALGNAIDLRGIVLGESEEITVREHWRATGEDAIHARFWRALVQRVIERAIFRGVIGPPTDDHLDHLHFDLGPSSYVAVERLDPAP